MVDCASFERAEIKDALSYLRLVNNRNDDPSFERVVNQPTRGIGNKTLDTVRDAARLADLSMWQASLQLIEKAELTARATKALNGFIELIQLLGEDTKPLELHEQVEHIIHASGLIDHYGKEKGEKAEARVENLEELVSAAKGFEYEQEEDENLEKLTAFLTHAALEAGEGQAQAWEDCVQLMTLHSAKGLEFPLVFMCGMEEGLFPHQRSAGRRGSFTGRASPYVMSALPAPVNNWCLAMQSIVAYTVKKYTPCPPAFLAQIPSQYIEEIRPKVQSTKYSDPFSSNTTNLYASSSYEKAAGFTIGQRVMHQKFGEGTILNYEGQGKSARVEVHFDQVGSKWLVLSYANLQAA